MKLHYRHVSPLSISSEEQLAFRDAIEEVTFIGYPNGMWDEVHLLPVARRGDDSDASYGGLQRRTKVSD